MRWLKSVSKERSELYFWVFFGVLLKKPNDPLRVGPFLGQFWEQAERWFAQGPVNLFKPLAASFFTWKQIDSRGIVQKK